MSAAVLLGTQGWKVGAWVGPFYPHGTTSADKLTMYARAFNTVEIGSSSFAIPAEPVVRDWAEQVPGAFRFACKVPQKVTHERQLQDTEIIVRRFLDRVSVLGERLGPLLVQLSPAFRPNEENHAIVDAFCGALPTEFQWAVEFRHVGWMTGATLGMLRSHGIATVLTDSRWISREMMPDLALEPTADFAYLRWEGTGRRRSRPRFLRGHSFDVVCLHRCPIDARACLQYQRPATRRP